ncbi:MAG TPA: hypothetical protein VFG30_01030 [Polyangiales bacterium]|nr:hypothetical protein [Polyangiales bacterium]
MSSSRTDLLALAQTILDAWVARKPDAVPRGRSFRYTENGQDVPLGAGLWSSVTSSGFRWVIADTETQQVLAFAVLMEGDAPCLAAFRARSDGERCSELEVLVSRKGQSTIFSPERLTQLDPLYEELVPESERGDRAALQAAADAYFDGIERDDATIVPFHEDCRRFENGALTTNNPEFLRGMACREQFEQKLFAYIESVRARRYPVADVERGLVGACVFLDVPGTVTHFEFRGRRHELPEHMRVPRSVLLFEVFKVVAGSIREIQAFMINLPYRASSGWE